MQSTKEKLFMKQRRRRRKQGTLDRKRRSAIPSPGPMHWEMISSSDIPPMTLEDVIDNAEMGLVSEWADYEAHRRTLLDFNLDENDELDLADEWAIRYFNGDESSVNAFHSWLERRQT